MTDGIVARIREQANAGYINEHEVMLHTAADEIDRLQNALANAVDAVYGMVVQYCQDHRYNILDSGFLHFPADAMRLLDDYGLLKDFEDSGGRYVSAAVPSSGDYRIVKQRIQMIREGQLKAIEEAHRA